MKNLRFTSLLSSGLLTCALAFGTLATAPSAAAQESSPAKVTIPFAFQVGLDRMPAGTYQIQKEDEGLILLRGPDRTDRFIVMHSAVTLSAPSHGKVVFHRYGSKYFLSQIWQAGEKTGLECQKSRTEKDVVLAQNKQASDLVELALYTTPQR
ncbi:MAG TPA: hypothetical protein VIX42_07690 [Edaphobacter sp.]